MLTTKQLLYQKVESARESCCGCCPLERKDLLQKVDEAIVFALESNAPTNLLDKLVKAKKIIKREKTFKHRLSADQILCDILNHDLK